MAFKYQEEERIIEKVTEKLGRVLKKLTDVIYRVQLGARKKPVIVHQNRLKPYLGDDPPLWLLKPSKQTTEPTVVTTLQALRDL